MKIGMVSPYPWDVPGGVVAHIRDLTEQLAATGHEVSVMAPVNDSHAPLPAYVTRAGRAVPVRYNGSTSHLVFGPRSASRVRRWLRDGQFDILHVHSPETLSLSLLAVICARGAIVSTYHAYNPRSRILSLLQTPLQAQLEKVKGRIAVSAAARRTIVEHLGQDAVLIPNGVDVARFAGAAPLPGYQPDGHTLGFLGRLDEPRKGLDVLLAAFAAVRVADPQARLLLAGPGRERPPTDGVACLGLLSEADKPRFYRSLDAFVAPNTGGESFGIVLLEAMAAGTPVLASDLEAFRTVLDDGRSGLLVPVGDAAALAAACRALLASAERRAALAAAGRELVRRYDWSVIAREVLRVYETVIVSGTPVAVDDDTVDLWSSQSSLASSSSLPPAT